MSAVLEQAKKIVNELSPKERLTLGKYCLDKEVMKDRFTRFLDKIKSKNIPITFEEITAEVEAVREEMYQERVNKK